MNKLLALGATCATLMAAYSCTGGGEKAPSAPVAEPTATSDTIKYVNNNEPTGCDVVNYNAAGQKVSVEAYNAKGALTDKTIWQDGKPTWVTTYGDQGQEDGNTTYAYDEQGKPVRVTTSAFNADRQKIEPTVEYQYTYDAAGHVTSVKELKYVNLRWVKEYEWTYAYDAEGRLAERKDYTGDGKEAKQSCWYTYTYGNGPQIEQEDYYFYDIKTGKLKHDAKFRYTYNAAGQVLTKTMIRHKNNQKRDDINSRLFTYIYNPAGQLTSLQEQKWNSGQNSWYEVKSSTWEYDEQGRASTATTITSTNKGMKIAQEYYTYAADSKAAAAVAAPAADGQPVVNLDEKHLTKPEEEE